MCILKALYPSYKKQIGLCKAQSELGNATVGQWKFQSAVELNCMLR